MKKMFVGLFALLFCAGAALADTVGDVTDVTLDGGSLGTATSSAPAGWGYVGTRNAMDLTAAIAAYGNGVQGMTTGTSSTSGEGRLNQALSGVLGDLNLSLRPMSIDGSGGTEQYAHVDATDKTTAKVGGLTVLNGWVDPAMIMGHAYSYTFDGATDPHMATGSNGGSIWLDMALGYTPTAPAPTH